MNVNVLSVCSSTYCLSERRSMELSIMLDLTWHFVWTSHVCIGFIPPLLFYYKTTLAQCFCISAALAIALRYHGINGNGIHAFVFGWRWLLSSLRTWTMGRRFSLTNIPRGLDYEKTRLLPSSVLSISTTGHRKVQRVSFVPKTTFWSRTAIGYLQKAEAGVLLKYKPNEYRWQGTMKSVEFDQYGNLLYKFSTEAHQIIWAQRKYPLYV